MSNDTIYLLSLTCNTAEGTSIYMCNYVQGNVDPGERDDYKFDMSQDIRHAKVFYSRQDAWNFREDVDRREWQIMPISAKKLFTKKLKAAHT